VLWVNAWRLRWKQRSATRNPSKRRMDQLVRWTCAVARRSKTASRFVRTRSYTVAGSRPRATLCGSPDRSGRRSGQGQMNRFASERMIHDHGSSRPRRLLVPSGISTGTVGSAGSECVCRRPNSWSPTARRMVDPQRLPRVRPRPLASRGSRDEWPGREQPLAASPFDVNFVIEGTGLVRSDACRNRCAVVECKIGKCQNRAIAAPKSLILGTRQED
jgi:hypothetical protein